jgi:hypothetical protein
MVDEGAPPSHSLQFSLMSDMQREVMWKDDSLFHQALFTKCMSQVFEHKNVVSHIGGFPFQHKILWSILMISNFCLLHSVMVLLG